jgi:hypothetical protein
MQQTMQKTKTCPLAGGLRRLARLGLMAVAAAGQMGGQLGSHLSSQLASQLSTPAGALALRSLAAGTLVGSWAVTSPVQAAITQFFIGEVAKNRGLFDTAVGAGNVTKDVLSGLVDGTSITRTGYTITSNGGPFSVAPNGRVQAPSLGDQANGEIFYGAFPTAVVKFTFATPQRFFGLEVGSINPMASSLKISIDGALVKTQDLNGTPGALIPAGIEFPTGYFGCVFLGFTSDTPFSQVTMEDPIDWLVFGGTIRYGSVITPPTPPTPTNIFSWLKSLESTALFKGLRGLVFTALNESKRKVASLQALGKAMNASAAAGAASSFLGRTLSVARTAGSLRSAGTRRQARFGAVDSGSGPSAMAPGMLAQAVAAGDLDQLVGMTGHRAQLINQPRAKNSPLQTVMAGIASASGQGIHHSGDGVTVWMQPLGQYARIKGRTGLEAWGGGVIGGAMMDVRPQLGLGFVGGYMANQMKPRDADAKAVGLKADSHRMTHTGLLGPSLRFTQSQDGTGLAVDQLVLGSFGRVHDKRDLPFVGMVAKSRFNTWGVTSSTEASYGFAVNKNFLVAPVAVFDASYSHEADHREKGADVFDLRFGRVRSTTLSQQGGVRVKYSWDRADQSQMAAELTATCLTTQPLDRKKQVKRDFIIDSSPFFEAVGGKNTVRANLQAGLTYRTPKGWTFGAAGSAQLGKNHTSASAMLTAGCTF